MNKPNEIERLCRELAQSVDVGPDKPRSAHEEPSRDNRSIPDLIDELSRLTGIIPSGKDHGPDDPRRAQGGLYKDRRPIPDLVDELSRLTSTIATEKSGASDTKASSAEHKDYVERATAHLRAEIAAIPSVGDTGARESSETFVTPAAHHRSRRKTSFTSRQWAPLAAVSVTLLAATLGGIFVFQQDAAQRAADSPRTVDQSAREEQMPVPPTSAVPVAELSPVPGASEHGVAGSVESLNKLEAPTEAHVATEQTQPSEPSHEVTTAPADAAAEIGRASCRERV